MIETVVVVTGGEAVTAGAEIPQGAYVIAADSGLDLAMALGLEVHLLVGDLDSVSSTALEKYKHVPIERHPVDKDATDLALAIAAAVRMDPDRIMVVGGTGGRLDHLLANASLLASGEYAGIDIEWISPDARTYVVHSFLRLHGSPGDMVSLIPFGGAASGVTTRGLRWTLEGADLAAGSTRGISNQMTAPIATVGLESGTLLVVHYEELSARSEMMNRA
jgi:thiamine pyrophosphokinase